MANTISVVILNWNGVDMLRRFLPSVVEYSDNADVWIVDNASTDQSCDFVKTNFPQVNLLAFDRNYGFAEGYNRAMEKIETPLALLLNSDVEVTPGWLDPLGKYMIEHPDVACCQPKIKDFRNKQYFEYAGAAGGFMDKLGYPYCRGRIFNCLERDRGQYDEVIPVFWATGAALMVRTEIYRRVGGLECRFFAHMEEIDFCWRVKSRGWGIVCIPRSTVYHVGGGTLPKTNPKKTYLNFRNNLFLLYNHLPTSRLVFVLCCRFFLDWLAVVVYVLKGEWRAGWAVVKARIDFWRMFRKFRSVRVQNRACRTTKNIPEMKPDSILYAYYVNHCRTFRELRKP